MCQQRKMNSFAAGLGPSFDSMFHVPRIGWAPFEALDASTHAYASVCSFVNPRRLGRTIFDAVIWGLPKKKNMLFLARATVSRFNRHRQLVSCFLFFFLLARSVSKLLL